MIRDPHHEQMSRGDLQKLQLERLKAQIAYVYDKSPFYQRVFKEKGIKPGDVQSLSDITKLPFTSKLDFRDNYPFGLMAVSINKVVRFHSSSGTTGKPVIAPYTQGDIDPERSEN